MEASGSRWRLVEVNEFSGNSSKSVEVYTEARERRWKSVWKVVEYNGCRWKCGILTSREVDMKARGSRLESIWELVEVN